VGHVDPPAGSPPLDRAKNRLGVERDAGFGHSIYERLQQAIIQLGREHVSDIIATDQPAEAVETIAASTLPSRNDAE
jgi:hypothetical protein